MIKNMCRQVLGQITTIFLIWIICLKKTVFSVPTESYAMQDFISSDCSETEAAILTHCSPPQNSEMLS